MSFQLAAAGTGVLPGRRRSVSRMSPAHQRLAARLCHSEPIIAQDVVRVSHRDSVDDLVARGRELERVVVARAVQLYLVHRVTVYGNVTVVLD